jgi:hypothetical protein
LPSDILTSLWFVLAAVAFWGPYFGLSLSAGLLNALYAVFLLVSLAALALRLLRQAPAPGALADPLTPPRKEDAPRRAH